MKLKNILTLAVLSICSVAAVLAAPIVELGSDKTSGQFTSLTQACTASSQTITLASPSRHIHFRTDAAAGVVYIRLDGTAATTANYAVQPGGSLSLDGLPNISQVTVIGAAATGTESILAW